jgi:hypothetical protein
MISRWCSRHAPLTLVGLAILAAFAAVAHAQGVDEPLTAAVVDPTAALLVELLKGGGLPAVVGIVAWFGRGALAQGVPVVIRLADEDRALLRDLARRGDHTDPGAGQ